MLDDLKAVIGRNLRLSREAAKISQGDFADMLGVSRQTLSAIENGKVAPDGTRLLSASRIVGCPISDFFRAEEEEVGLLFRAAEHVVPSTPVRAKFQRLSRAYRELEEVVGVSESSIAPPEYSYYPDTWSRSAQFAYQVAEYERERLGLGSREPVDNLFKLLEENGVRIMFEKIEQDGISGISGYSRRSGPCILVNDNDTLERNIFTVAHELGHLLMHRYLYQPGASNAVAPKTDTDIEKMAHQFAGAFLVPEHGLREVIAKNLGKQNISLEDIVFLKKNFRVSAEVILRRLSALGICSDAGCDAIRVEMRKHEPDPTREYRPLQASELIEWKSFNRFTHLQRKAATEGMISTGRLAELLGKNVIEARSLVQQWRGN